eukprot:5509025-Alexandrium_andersonii.AAC.1
MAGSRKSTTSLKVFLDACLVFSCSRTQKVLALSSAEAEYYGIVAAACESLQLQAIFASMIFPVSIVIYSDSSSGICILQRPGPGKIMHVDMAYLFVQQLVIGKKIVV